jgi:hypothetical protein
LAGHCLSSPLSLDKPLRSGPRHCGHSASAVVFPAVTDNKAKAHINANENKILTSSPLTFCRLCVVIGLFLRLKP